MNERDKVFTTSCYSQSVYLSELVLALGLGFIVCMEVKGNKLKLSLGLFLSLILKLSIVEKLL